MEVLEIPPWQIGDQPSEAFGDSSLVDWRPTHQWICRFLLGGLEVSELAHWRLALWKIGDSSLVDFTLADLISTNLTLVGLILTDLTLADLGNFDKFFLIKTATSSFNRFLNSHPNGRVTLQFFFFKYKVLIVKIESEKANML